MMKDLEIAFTAKEITAFGGVSLLYKMLDNCHFNVGGRWHSYCGEYLSGTGLEEAPPNHYGQTGNR